MKRAHALVLLAAAAVAAAGGGAVYHHWSRTGGAVAAGSGAVVERVYATRLADLKGGIQTVGQWQGQVLVVNFWATWCAPCREEIPGFARLQERHGPRGLQFVGIAIDQADKVADFSQEFRINYPLLIGGLESMELMREAGNRTGVLPFTLIIDRGGKLISGEPGGLKESRLEQLIEPLL
jgi:thiol-disulfide isomerase/thioredoxin